MYLAKYELHIATVIRDAFFQSIYAYLKYKLLLYNGQRSSTQYVSY